MKEGKKIKSKISVQHETVNQIIRNQRCIGCEGNDKNDQISQNVKDIW